MATAKVMAGICGMTTEIKATADEPYGAVRLQITSDCPHVTKMAAELTEVQSLGEIAFRKGRPQAWQMAEKYCAHAACPVGVAVVKAVEVAAGLALPADVNIEVTKD